jgi:hypothetical protein
MENETKPIRHKIGCARTIRTAVLVCQYLSQRCDKKHIQEDSITYYFTDPTPNNGFWSADIIITTYAPYSKEQDRAISECVDICRAFVAGAGEIWA